MANHDHQPALVVVDTSPVGSLAGFALLVRKSGFEPGRGALGPWLQAQLPDVTYDCLLTEFGTYSALKVIAAMRYENRVVRFAPGDAKLRAEAAKRMHETFCPADAAWRAGCPAVAP